MTMSRNTNTSKKNTLLSFSDRCCRFSLFEQALVFPLGLFFFTAQMSHEQTKREHGYSFKKQLETDHLNSNGI